MTIVYDIETGSNRTVLGFLNTQTREFDHVDMTEPLDSDQRSEIASFLRGGLSDKDEAKWPRLIGFNNLGFDTFILNAILEGARPVDAFALGQDIIKSGKSAWEVARSHKTRKAPFNELDIKHFSPRDMKLKVMGARLQTAVVRTYPFTGDMVITDEQMPGMLEYLRRDLELTDLGREKVTEEMALREELGAMFGLNLMQKTPAAAAEAVLVHEYCRVENIEAEEVKNAARMFRDCTFTFELPAWIRPVIAGTVAEEIARVVDGTVFTIKAGKRSDPKHWPKSVRVGGLDVAFGVGGLHSEDEFADFPPMLDFDIASLYPNLILKPGGAPSHLNEAAFHKVYGGIVAKRLEAKAQGRKRESDSLKLVINSSFGQMNNPYSMLYAPYSFLNTTLCGQLSILSLAHKTFLGAVK